MIDRIAEKGDRSRSMEAAVKHYVDTVGRRNLRRLLIEGGRRRAERDLAIAEEWFPLDEEAWQRHGR
ncbi:MAG: hypothetical protein AAB225_05270 [Acidobacteriota bacterium]